MTIMDWLIIMTLWVIWLVSVKRQMKENRQLWQRIYLNWEPICPKEYEEGQHAYGEGLNEQFNPYAVDTTEYSAWQAGHRVASGKYL